MAKRRQATDEDWASPEFDYLQPYIARLENPASNLVGGHQFGLAEARRWREERPYLIQHIRDTCGDPKWDPRGASVHHLARGD